MYTKKYGLHGKLVAVEGKGEDLLNILLEASNLMKSAEGCRLYSVGINPDNPNEIWITEIWDSRQAHDDSLNLPGVRELIGQAIPILASNPEIGPEWDIIGGAGL